jgi:hypothetical protein
MTPVPQAPATPTPYAVPAPATPAAAPAAKKGSPVMKIVLIILAVLFLFGLLGAASCVYFIYRVKQKATQIEKQVQTNFPTPTGVGQTPVQPTTPAEAPGAAPTMGTAPLPDIATLSYPGAATAEGGSQNIFGMAGVKMQEYTTSDSVDTVAAYYKEKLGPSAMVTQTGGGAVVQVTGSNGVVSVTIAPDQASGKTKITVSSIGKQ